MESNARQLSLNITPRHAYSPQDYVMHEGVRELFEHCLNSLGRGAFFIGFVVGTRRSGKTHFSIRLADELGQKGLYPRLIEGVNFSQVLSDAFDAKPDDIIIIDDSDSYLSELQPGQSGQLVAFVEKLRAARSGLVLLSNRELSEYEFDDHIRSRILAGQTFRIGAPDEENMRDLVHAMAKQHGVRLSERKVDFLLRRVARNVPSLEQYFERLTHLAQVLGRPIRFPLMSGAV